MHIPCIYQVSLCNAIRFAGFGSLTDGLRARPGRTGGAGAPLLPLPCDLTTVLHYYLTTLLPYYITTLAPCYPTNPTTVLPYYRATVLPCYRATVLPYYLTRRAAAASRDDGGGRRGWCGECGAEPTDRCGASQHENMIHDGMG